VPASLRVAWSHYGGLAVRSYSKWTSSPSSVSHTRSPKRRRSRASNVANPPGGYGSVVVQYFMAPPVQRYEDLLRCDGAKYVAFHKGRHAHDIFILPMSLKRNNLSAAHTEEDIDRTLEAADDMLGGR
jgi:glutamate-1-semialdehyde aminotransferase